MRIAVDFDGTIANTIVPYLAFCKAQFNIDLPIEATVPPLRENYLSAQQIDLVRRHVCGTGTMQAPLVPGAREGMQLLAAAKHKLVILTARPSYGVGSAKEYLRTHRIPHDHFLFVSDSEKRTLADGRVLTKKIVLNELKFSVMIEDQAKGLVGISGDMLGILLTQPWNVGQSLPQGAIRAKNWDAIVKLLLQKAAA